MWLHSEASSREAGTSEVASPPPPCGRFSFTKAEAAKACKGKCVTSNTFCWWKAHGKPSICGEDYPRRCLREAGGQGLSAQQSAHSMPSWEMPTLGPAAA